MPRKPASSSWAVGSMARLNPDGLLERLQRAAVRLRQRDRAPGRDHHDRQHQGQRVDPPATREHVAPHRVQQQRPGDQRDHQQRRGDGHQPRAPQPRRRQPVDRADPQQAPHQAGYGDRRQRRHHQGVGPVDVDRCEQRQQQQRADHRPVERPPDAGVADPAVQLLAVLLALALLLGRRVGHRLLRRLVVRRPVQHSAPPTDSPVPPRPPVMARHGAAVLGWSICRGLSAVPGLVRSGSGAGVALHEPLQDLRGLEDPPRPGHLLHRLGLVGLEVARVPVDVDAGAEAVDVELGVELRGVDVPRRPGTPAPGRPAEEPSRTACRGSRATASLWPTNASKGSGRSTSSGSARPAGVSVTATRPIGSACSGRRCRPGGCRSRRCRSRRRGTGSRARRRRRAAPRARAPRAAAPPTWWRRRRWR